ncbi:His/Gly/Thr/Pro-type tRNA ligase C-terminal domain-containing protein [Flavipsychrobacter stenotrophus]|uniref:His/Gly/Thr/Pro-type tRNA ligase C-terminal domain-containing protein n=1 Tax=Flavipsychrobacter stenotrophus TaxID=2077091 RepID=UPI001374FF15|nr:His/Gly/Thr/Pro-type tRNA ligase C-terminal domain-containing protein [Flavipsychrobacter stenotrophus]
MKQQRNANKRSIDYVILPGDEEREKQLVSFKNFATREQKMISLQECVDLLK